jgi:hypothetical protein|tara:strand:- start:129 stop:515 length:387 start_codon:yes stop_codon:yes gene_type:complete
MDKIVQFEVVGEPASKANSRKAVVIRGKPAFIKSQKARDYVKAFGEQCPTLPELITDDVLVEILIYYASRRPDLDESLILDCMQDKIYKNDRQVKQKKIYWSLDKDNPRSIIRIVKYDILNIPSYLVY